MQKMLENENIRHFMNYKANIKIFISYAKSVGLRVSFMNMYHRSCCIIFIRAIIETISRDYKKGNLLRMDYPSTKQKYIITLSPSF